MPTQFAEERRANDSLVLTLVQQIHDSQRDLRHELSSHMAKETEALAEAVADLMRKSFPEGDPEGHRRAHEAQIKALEDRAAFWKKMLFEISKYGLFGLLSWALFVLWTAIIKGPNQ